MRINKYLTEQGFCSRREADKLIEDGRVRIGMRKAVLGDQVADGEQVFVDGKLIKIQSQKVYIMYNKPLGITCTTDLRVEGNIIQAVKYPTRIFPIGRLDKYSSGLIFLTNDGDIVNQILRAQFGHEKEYIVEINCPVTDEFLTKMSSGVDIGDYTTKPCQVKKIKNNTFSIILTEGKNRQIRRMCESLNTVVKHLERVRIMNVKLGHLPIGEWRDIPAQDLGELRRNLTQAQSQYLKTQGEIDVEE